MSTSQDAAISSILAPTGDCANRAVFLVPRGGQPVRGERGRQGASGNESEIAAARGRDGGGRPGLIEQRDYLLRIHGGVIQRTAQGIQPGDVFGRGGDATRPNPGNVSRRARGCIGQQFILVHKK